jgi:ubiquinone/menaquinone biosynthesis C-methylase UbiE
MNASAADPPHMVCPACRSELDSSDAPTCRSCDRRYPFVAGLPDLRLASDRYLDLPAERAKAERLAAISQGPGADTASLAQAYYEMTDDVLDHRRERFLRHIAGAVVRGEALVEALPAEGLTLEVGCGTGGLLVAAVKSGRRVVGVDVAARWLVVARRRLDDVGLTVPLVAAEAERLPWPNGSFDAVAADSVLEHLDDPAAALREWRRVVKPGGRLFVWSPNRYTLTTDPHVGLWGVGWLPRQWAPLYISWRCRSDWPPRTLSAFEAQRIARRCGWNAIATGPPRITRNWAATRPMIERAPLAAYSAARALPGLRRALCAFGPLWELRAEAGRAE